MRLLFASLLFLLSASYVLGQIETPCGDWIMYKQCDNRWGGDQLGTSSKTICDSGCAISSVAMSLNKYNSRIGRDGVTPSSFVATLTLENLNTWLKANGGYVSGNLLVWDSVSKLGQLQIIKYGSDITSPDLKKFIQHC